MAWSIRRPTKRPPGIRANGVPGVFSVENDLQVAGQPARKEVVNLNQQHAPRAALADSGRGRHILELLTVRLNEADSQTNRRFCR